MAPVSGTSGYLRVSPAGQQQIHQGQAFAQRQMLQHLAAVEPGLERSVEAVGKMWKGGRKHRENIWKKGNTMENMVIKATRNG